MANHFVRSDMVKCAVRRNINNALSTIFAVVSFTAYLYNINVVERVLFIFCLHCALCILLFLNVKKVKSVTMASFDRLPFENYYTASTFRYLDSRL